MSESKNARSSVLDLKAKTVKARYKLDGCDGSKGGLAYAAAAPTC